MTNTELLKEKIVDSGITISALSRKLSISRESLYKKINNVTEFKASEIVTLSKVLSLTIKEREAIFFTQRVE